MKREAIIDEVTKIIRQHLSEEYKVFIFGSWAKGNAIESSDIDIGILGREKVPWSTMTKILEKKDDIPTLRSIDIVDLNAVEEQFKNHVLEYAKIL